MIPFTTFTIWTVIKVAVLILLSLYFVFALVVIRQVKLMTSTLHLGFETPVIIVSYLHFAFSVLVFFSALVIL